jgi:hypothetical protein
MFQKGRPEQQIKYKQEVLKIRPDATWYKLNGIGGAIMSRTKRISEVYNVAWKAWEDAYYKLQSKQ